MGHDQSLPPRTGRSKQSGSSKAAPRKKSRVGKIVFSFLGLIILGLGVYAGYLYVKANKMIDDIAAPEETVVPSDQLAEAKPIGMLVLGLDFRNETGSMNTDVMMAAVFNPKSKTATVVSVPRDSDLDVPNYKTQKANAFYARFMSIGRTQEKLDKEQARIYASNEMKIMMSKFFDTPIDYVAVLDFQGFIDVVDALGGVNVFVDQDMRYWDNADGTDIDLKKGDQKLNGEDALGFVRYRKSKNGETPASSDFARNDRQDRVLGAIIDKLKTFGGVTKLGSVIDAVGKNMKTDIPKVQINNMISTYFGIDKKNVRFIALTGEWKSPYVHLDQAKLEEAKRALQEELRPEGRTVSERAPETPASSAGNGG